VELVSIVQLGILLWKSHPVANRLVNTATHLTNKKIIWTLQGLIETQGVYPILKFRHVQMRMLLILITRWMDCYQWHLSKSNLIRFLRQDYLMILEEITQAKLTNNKEIGCHPPEQIVVIVVPVLVALYKLAKILLNWSMCWKQIQCFKLANLLPLQTYTKETSHQEALLQEILSLFIDLISY